MNIAVKDLGVQIDGRTIFEAVSLEISPGTMTALTGPSGCGKTTLLNCLGLIQRPTGGAVLVGGVDTAGWRDARRTRFWKDHVAFIYQDYGIIDDRSVAYNVTLSKHRSRSTTKRVDEVLTAVGLSQRGEPAAVLSGGEKQRLGVARAMFKEATFIFADEPTASLDTENRELVTALLLSRASSGASVVIATHDSRLAESCGARFEVAGAGQPMQHAAAGGGR
ncbi:ABC transporter ATP-binding protein [Georgenia yuyongxinii]